MGKSLVIQASILDSRKRQRSKFQEELVAVAWETRRLLGGLASTSLDLPWVFLLVCGSGLARV